MPRALTLPGQGTRRGAGAVRAEAREFPWLNEATQRKLRGAQTRAEWIDRVADATSYNARERDELTEKVFRTKVRAYEDRVTAELRRTGVLGKRDRWRLAPEAAARQEMWEESEGQVARVADTYDRDRRAWAGRMKAERRRQNRHAVAADFDRWNEGRAAWKAKQVEDTEAMMADMRAGDEMYHQAKIADPKRDKAWYWQTTAGGAASPVRKTKARGGGRGRRAGKMKLSSGPCRRCLQMQGGNPYTRQKLIARATQLKALDPKHFVMHPNERCTVYFKPGGQVLRAKANRQKAEQWALRNGTVSRARALPVQHAEAVSAGRMDVLCPVLRKEMGVACVLELTKKAKGGGRYRCPRAERVQLGYDGERVAHALYGGRLTYKAGDKKARNAPLDILGAEDGKTGIEVKVSHWDADFQGTSMKPDAVRRKLAYLKSEGMERGKSVCVLMDGPDRAVEVYEMEGFGTRRVSQMTLVRRFEPDELDWGKRAVTEAKTGKPRRLARVKGVRK